MFTTTVTADYDRRHETYTSASENARNIFDAISLFLTLRQLTEIWLNRTYVDETETRT